MLKKICPVCDQPIGSLHYCRVCHRFVRHPIVWRENFYLNERHSASEAGCEYHMPEVRKPAFENPEDRGAFSGDRGSKGWNFDGPFSKWLTLPEFSGRSGPGKRAVNSILVLFLVFAVMMVANLVPVGVQIVRNVRAHSLSFFDAENLAAAGTGERCSGKSHFDVKVGELVDLFRDQLGGEGYIIESDHTYTDNSVRLDGDRTVSSYNTFTVLEVSGNAEFTEEDHDYQMVEIDYDTVTLELHKYISILQDRERSLSLLRSFVEYVEEAYGIEEADSSFPAIEEELRASLDKGEVYYDTQGPFSVTCSESRGTIYIHVYHRDGNGAKASEL